MGVDEVEFATSGSTGEPQKWVRTKEQIEAEAALLIRTCGAEQVDGVVCYAPPKHLYGHLLGLAVPRLLGVRCTFASLTGPPPAELSTLRCPLVAAVPAAFAVLERCPDLVRGVLVHSSAVLPPSAKRLLTKSGAARFVELFGSTETGLVAARTNPGGAWTLADDVGFAQDSDDEIRALRVTSPRLARLPDATASESIETDDLITVLDERTFRWHGRRSRLVKVNGKRVNLDLVEARLREAAPRTSVTAVAETDALRGEWFSVHADTADPHEIALIRAALKALPSWEQPRALTSSGTSRPRRSA